MYSDSGCDDYTDIHNGFDDYLGNFLKSVAKSHEKTQNSVVNTQKEIKREKTVDKGKKIC